MITPSQQVENGVWTGVRLLSRSRFVSMRISLSVSNFMFIMNLVNIININLTT